MSAPPPLPPPLPPSARRHIDNIAQLPPHVLAMTQQLPPPPPAMSFDLRSELPMQFGGQPRWPKKQVRSQQQAPPQGNDTRGRGSTRGGRGGRGRGRGNGGASHQRNTQSSHYGGNATHHRGGGRGGYNNNNTQFKRKRGSSDDATDATRFFLPSCLENPWARLEAAAYANNSNVHVVHQQQQLGAQSPPLPPVLVMRPNQTMLVPPHVRLNNAATNQRASSRPGRALFQPSFLADPWQQLGLSIVN